MPFRTLHKQTFSSCQLWCRKLYLKYTSISSRLLRTNTVSSAQFTSQTPPKPYNILFFGTDEFAVTCLQSVHNLSKLKLVNVDVVSLHLHQKDCAVVKYAKEHSLQLEYWPVTVQVGKYDVGVVVSFGHLIPSRIIQSFPLGMINVHASLLPRWRGSAPVIHAILNGDVETGITVMKIQPKKFDTGEILATESIVIDPHVTGRQLASQLSVIGANVLSQCLLDFPNTLENAKSQSKSGITSAPKVTSTLAKILWKEKTALEIYNQYRALCGIYKIWSTWQSRKVRFSNALPPQATFQLKLETLVPGDALPGFVYFHKKRKLLCVKCYESWIVFHLVQIEGKPEMSASDFYNGFMSKVPRNLWYFVSDA